MDESKLVQNRTCGECSACCTNLKIDDGNFKKSADVRCPHLISSVGCGIYQTRPAVCKAWYCAWRFMGQLGDEWRPDHSGIIIRFHHTGGLVFQPIRDAVEVLTTESALNIIGGGVLMDMPVFVSVPTKPGYCHYLAQANQALATPVRNKDMLATRLAMIQLINLASIEPTVLESSGNHSD